MSGDSKPSRRVVENARSVVQVLATYRHFDEGLISERELRHIVGRILAVADVPLLVTALAHSNIELMKRVALARGGSVAELMKDTEAELRPFANQGHPGE